MEHAATRGAAGDVDGGSRRGRRGVHPRATRARCPRSRDCTDFPGSICTSINDEIVHGIPSKKRVLKDGDIISIDVGVGYEGYFTDSATTVAVGAVDDETAAAARASRERRSRRGSPRRVPGNHLGDIGAAVQARRRGGGVQRRARPRGPRHRRRVPRGAAGAELRQAQAARRKLVPGLTMAIEPMVNIGGPATRTLPDRWTIVTVDGSRSAHFEHTVAITENGPRVLTRA